MAVVWKTRKTRRWEIRDRKKKLICIAYASGPADCPSEKIAFEWPNKKRKIDRKTY
jgi:hypothetical protein